MTNVLFNMVFSQTQVFKNSHGEKFWMCQSQAPWPAHHGGICWLLMKVARVKAYGWGSVWLTDKLWIFINSKENYHHKFQFPECSNCQIQLCWYRRQGKTLNVHTAEAETLLIILLIRNIASSFSLCGTRMLSGTSPLSLRGTEKHCILFIYIVHALLQLSWVWWVLQLCQTLRCSLTAFS